MKIIGVTACATGIAHTFIAAESIEKTGRSLGHQVLIEKQGREVRDVLSQKDIDEADVVIIAADVDVKGMSRFSGKLGYTIGTKQAIRDPRGTIKILSNKSELEKFPEVDNDTSNPLSGFVSTKRDRWDTTPLKNKYKRLMAGVSMMLPVIIVGGIMVGISFLIDIGVTNDGLGNTRSAAKIFGTVGGWLLNNLTPMFLAGFIAKSMVGDKGLVPGFVAGLVASGLFGDFGGLIPDFQLGEIDIYTGKPQMFSSILKSGFLGAIVGGFFAGFSIWLLENTFYKIKGQFSVPKELIFIPLFACIITSLFMMGINFPLGYLMYYMNKGLLAMQDLHIDVILAGILGMAMAIDMGGPINKTASLVAIANLVDNGSSVYMAAVMAAGMIPPLVISFSTVIFRSEWTKEEKNAAKVNWVLGAFYITEGAIPFAAKDPKKVIPILMLSSAIGAMIVTSLSISISAPHGGIFVAPLLRSSLFSSTALSTVFAIIFYILSILMSALMGGIILGFWKKYTKKAKEKHNKLTSSKKIKLNNKELI